MARTVNTLIERRAAVLVVLLVLMAVIAVLMASVATLSKKAGKFASAHDMRRAFGTRWAKRVMPAVLQRLMRHADIGTTMRYYVSAGAADVAEELWAKFGPAEEAAADGNTPAPGNKSGNIGPHRAETAKG